MKNFYDFEAELPSGKIIKMEDYKWKVILIANTASRCGLAYQYKWLQTLHELYEDKGLVVLAFPCNQFAEQEPLVWENIKEQCLINYWVKFTVCDKIEVNGDWEHPLFTYLKRNSNNIFGKRIKWNFTKFLVSKDGTKIERFA